METKEMLHKASPRKPSVVTVSRSSNRCSFDVVCRWHRMGRSAFCEQAQLRKASAILNQSPCCLQAARAMHSPGCCCCYCTHVHTLMPWPLSVICSSLQPPSFTSTAICVAPASRLFSSSSCSHNTEGLSHAATWKLQKCIMHSAASTLRALAGRWMISPAAILFTTASGSLRILGA